MISKIYLFFQLQVLATKRTTWNLWFVFNKAFNVSLKTSMVENMITFCLCYTIIVEVRLFTQYASTALDLLVVLLFQPSPCFVLIYISVFFQQRAYWSGNLTSRVSFINEIGCVNKQANWLLFKHLSEFGLLENIHI